MSTQAVKTEGKGRFSLFKLLKAMTVAEIPLMVIPGIFISVAVLGKVHFGWSDFLRGILALAIVTVLASILGYIAVRYDSREKEPDFSKAKATALKLIAYAVSPVVSLPLALLFWPIRPEVGLYGYLAPWLPAFLTLEICWVLTVQTIPGSYTMSYSTNDFMICAGIHLIPIAVIELLRPLMPYVSYDVIPMALSFSVYTIIGCIVVNQQNIDIMMERRRHDKASLPGKIRVYNLLLICGLLILVFSGLLIGEQLGTAIIWMLKRFGLAIIYLIVLAFKLMSLGQGGGGSGGGDGGGTPDMSGLGEGAKESPIWDFILLLIIAFALYALFSNRRRIWEHISELFVKFVTKLYHFFLDCFKVQELGSTEGYYTEEAEDISSEERFAPINGFKNKREMKRALKQWQKTSDPEQRVRDGYRLLMMASRTQDKDLKVSDTTGEILDKNRQSSLETAFAQANPIYDRVRYDGAVPDAAELSGFAAKVEESCLAVDVKKKK